VKEDFDHSDETKTPESDIAAQLELRPQGLCSPIDVRWKKSTVHV
jgi:hypothetical protein